MTGPPQDAPRLPLGVRLAYAAGSAAFGMKAVAISTVMLFYNQVLGLSPYLGGLAILLALALFVLGLGELVFASGRPRPWVGYVLGAVFLVAALVTVLRPGKSLYFLAVFVGASMILTGVLQLALALFDRQDIEHWVVLAVIGVVGIVAGVLAIAWPHITIWVLGLVVGLRVLFFGLLEMFVANQLRQLTS